MASVEGPNKIVWLRANNGLGTRRVPSGLVSWPNQCIECLSLLALEEAKAMEGIASWMGTSMNRELGRVW